MKLSLALIARLLLLLLPSHALAFKPEGHKELESIAYAELAGTAKFHVAGATFSGSEVLQGLKRAHVLDGNLLPGSGGPDLAFERQFDTRNQTFHFMADNGDVRAAAKESNPRQALLERALPKNLSVMRLLFDETVENPTGAFQAGRGVYVLLHIVGDAFSREHVERDENNRLITIKGWRLLGIGWPEAAEVASGKSKDGHALPSLLHHAFVAGADLDWRESVVGNQKRLTPEGRRAVEAMKSLLVTIYGATLVGEGSSSKTFQDRRDQLWAEFVEEHFNNVPCPLSNGQWTCSEQNQLAAASLQKRMRLIDADAFPSWQISLGASARFLQEPTIPILFGQVLLERHVVPYQATGLLPRLRPGFSLALRVPVADSQVVGAPQHWYTGKEGTLQIGVSTMIPWIHWLGIYGGAGLRGGQRPEPGGAVSLAWNLYFRRYVALTARWEHNWWRDSGYSNNLGVGLSLFWVHAREVDGFDYN